ncbi:GlsB/YeaQ/YmgE family stress response membrane protein [Bradyrhizobium sp. 38]|uniref:GlsB/YeaQ/YmgE family stress response membrane protein n=1 Tax=Bradyrhizobium sp. 38 TaxID=2782672 RepID=UPI001FFA1B35|nr:GlsB/YeaQ/YmgE family stress response membrane protein [Bradyrhizobium sp. 38]
MSIIWTIVIGFIAGVIAKFIMPGDNEPSGFILTTILGIVGAFVATYLGQSLGWYRPGEGAGLVGAVVGAIIVLLVYGFLRQVCLLKTLPTSRLLYRKKWSSQKEA